VFQTGGKETNQQFLSNTRKGDLICRQKGGRQKKSEQKDTESSFSKRKGGGKESKKRAISLQKKQPFTAESEES